MTINDIYKTLNNPAYLHAGTLTLPDSALGSPDVQALIDAYLPGDALIINDAYISQNDTSVTVTGTGGGAPFTGMQVTAIFTVSEDGSEAELAMTATVGAAWTFVSSFPVLADTFFEGLQFDTASKFYFNSYAVPNVAPPGLSFDGTLTASQSSYMAALAWLFPSSSLAVKGPIALVNQVPQMDLNAPLGTAVQIGYFEAPAQFTLSSSPLNTDPPAPAPIAYTEIVFQADITFRTSNTAVVLPVQAAYLGSGSLLVFDLDLNNVITAALSELESLMNGTALNAVLPPGWSSDFPIGLASFEVVVDPENRDLVTVTTAVATNQVWTVIPNLFAVEQVGLAFTLLDPMAQAGSSALALGLFGQVRIGSTGVMRVECGYPGFQLSGQLDPTTKINLKEIAEYFVGSLPDVPTIEVAELEFFIDALNGTYEGSAMVSSDWTISLGSVQLAIEMVYFAIDRTTDSTLAMIGGQLGIGSATIDIVWNLPGDIQFNGQLPAISLTELIQLFSSQPLTYTLPDLQLINAVLFIEENVSTGNFYMALGTSVEYNGVDWGDFEIEFINTNAGTGFAFGFVLPQSWTLADLSSAFSSLAWLKFRNLSLIVATVNDPTFAFRSISTQTVAFPTRLPGTTQPGVQAGMMFYAELLLEGGALDTVSRLLGGSTSLMLSAFIPSDNYSNTTLTAALNGAFNLIGEYVVLNNVYLQMQPLNLYIDFHVDMTFTLFNSPSFTLGGDIALEGEELDFALRTETPWVYPFGIKGLIIVSMGVEFTLGPMVTFSLAGKVVIGSGASRIDVEVGGEFNVDEEGIPDVLLAVEHGTIKLKDVIETFTRAHVPADLVDIELRGFTLIIVANPLGWLNPDDKKFYGFGLAFSTSLYFYGLEADFALQVSYHTGISASGSMSAPLRIANLVTLASATDPAKGPYFEINSATSPYLTFNARLTMYEIASYAVNAQVSSGAFYFAFDYSISGLGQVHFDCYLQNKNEFAFDASAYFAVSNIDIKTAGNRQLGTLKIHLYLNAAFSIHIGPGGTFLLTFSATFNLQGYSLSISGQLTTSISTLASLLTKYVEALAANLWTVAARVFQDVTALFAFVGQGALALTDQIASILYSELRTNVTQAVQLLKGVAHVMSWSIRDITSMIKSAYGATATDLARALKAAGYDVELVADAIGHVFGMAYDDVANVLKTIGYDLGQIAQALKNVFGKSAKDVAKFFKDTWKIADTVVHDALGAAGYVASEIEDAMKKVFNWVSDAAHTVVHYLNPKNW